MTNGKNKRLRAERFSRHLDKLDSVRERGLVHCFWDESLVCDWFYEELEGLLGGCPCPAFAVDVCGKPLVVCPRIESFVRDGVFDAYTEVVRKLVSEWDTEMRKLVSEWNARVSRMPKVLGEAVVV